MNHSRNLRKERKCAQETSGHLRKGLSPSSPTSTRWGEFLGNHGGHGLAQRCDRGPQTCVRELELPGGAAHVCLEVVGHRAGIRC